MATIQYGPGNSVTRPINHTREIPADVYAVLGASPENSQTFVNGAAYEGPLSATDVVELRQKANSKAV